MKTVGYTLVALVAIGVILVCLLGGCYNTLVSNRQNVQNAWANVQVQYQRRVDLVNQVLPIVQGAATQELAVFRTLRDQAAALSGAFNQAPKTDAEAQGLQNKVAGFNSALINFVAYGASNPQIQSVQAFRDFQTQIEGSENRIAVARRDYNAAVQQYKLTVQLFPMNMIAPTFGFSSNDFAYFAADEGSQNAPKIVFPTPDMSK